jgi:hypothetical protein
LSVGRGRQETSRLPEIQAKITEVTARTLGSVRGMLAWAQLVRTDNDELLRLEKEMRAVQGKAEPADGE